MTTEQKPRRTSLFPPGMGPMRRYNSPSILDADLQRCRQLGWQVALFSCDAWSTMAAAHEDLSTVLSFPDHYGSNLDALHDVMSEIAEGGQPFGADAIGAVIAFHRFDRFAAAFPRQAEAVVEILGDSAYQALTYGWPLSYLFQTDNHDLRIEPRRPAAVEWTPAERNPGPAQ